jgi:hypothetical protein
MLSRQVATIFAPDVPVTTTTIENGSKGEPDMSRQAATEAIPPVMEAPVHPQEPRHDTPTDHDMPRQAAAEHVPPVMQDRVPPPEPRHEAATGHDTPRQTTTEPEVH